MRVSASTPRSFAAMIGGNGPGLHDAFGMEQQVRVLRLFEDDLRGVVGSNRIAAGRVHDSLWLTGSPRGVKNVERMLGIERLSFVLIGRLRHQLVPPMISPSLHLHRAPRALVDDNAFYARRTRERLIHRCFQLHFIATTMLTILCDDRHGLCVINAVDK